MTDGRLIASSDRLLGRDAGIEAAERVLEHHRRRKDIAGRPPEADAPATQDQEPGDSQNVGDPGPDDGPPGSVALEDAADPEDAHGPRGEGTDAVDAAPHPPPGAAKSVPKEDPSIHERVSSISAGLEEDRQALRDATERFQTLEERMKKLQYLSELLSVRYNPFLDQREGRVFDGDRHDLARLVPGLAAGAAPPSPPGAAPASPAGPTAPATAPPAEGGRPAPVRSPLAEVVRPYLDDENEDGRDGEGATHGGRGGRDVVGGARPEEPAGEATAPAHEGVRPDDAGHPHGGTAPGPPTAAETASTDGAWVGGEATEATAERSSVPASPTGTSHEARPSARPAPRPPARPGSAQAPPPVPTPARQQLPTDPGAFPAVAPPVHRPKETYMLLRWMERLAEGADPAVVHLFLEHYRRMGWIGDEAHAWFRAVAEGFAAPIEGATWRTFGLDGRRLLRLHKASLRFLELFFRGNLPPNEVGRLQSLVDRMMEVE